MNVRIILQELQLDTVLIYGSSALEFISLTLSVASVSVGFVCYSTSYLNVVKGDASTLTFWDTATVVAFGSIRNRMLKFREHNLPEV